MQISSDGKTLYLHMADFTIVICLSDKTLIEKKKTSQVTKTVKVNKRGFQISFTAFTYS